MQNVLKKEKLEQLLLSKCQDFIDMRKILTFIKTTISQQGFQNHQVFEFKINRFELTNPGFLLWSDVILLHEQSKVNITIEFLLTFDGSLLYQNHI